MVNVSGDWRFFGQPEREGVSGRGEVRMTLRQHGTDITGELVQAIDPWTEKPPQAPESTRAGVIGRLYPGSGTDATLIELMRVNHHSSFRAIFTGIVAAEGFRVHGHVVNSNANTGTFRMERIEGE